MLARVRFVVSRASLLLATAALVGCASTRTEPRDVTFGALPGERSAEPGAPRRVTQFELQQDVQRFTGAFTNRLLDSSSSLFTEDLNQHTKTQLLSRLVLYYSGALDVTTGALPEVNVLDMVVFIRLSRSVLERHWIPLAKGHDLGSLARAFRDSEADVWKLAAKVLNPQQRETLKELIDDWLAQHPDAVNVESVRFAQFTERASDVAVEVNQKAQGLVGSVRGVAVIANQTLLLGERGMFLANRMPFLVRLQARLGAREVVGDSLQSGEEVAKLLDKLPNPDPTLRELASLTAESRQLIRESRATVEALKPLLGNQGLPATVDAIKPLLGDKGLPATLDASNRLADKGLALVREVKDLKPNDPAALATSVETQMDRLARRIIAYLALLGAVCSIVFWGGYYVVKRLRPELHVPRYR